jgi:hypothetical protein
VPGEEMAKCKAWRALARGKKENKKNHRVMCLAWRIGQNHKVFSNWNIFGGSLRLGL